MLGFPYNKIVRGFISPGHLVGQSAWVSTSTVTRLLTGQTHPSKPETVTRLPDILAVLGWCNILIQTVAIDWQMVGTKVSGSPLTLLWTPLPACKNICLILGKKRNSF